MVNYSWNWAKLPVEYHSKVVEYYESHNWLEIILLHNEYKLSVNDYCCCDTCVEDHVRNAITNNIIK